jgi:hypothetical protein
VNKRREKTLTAPHHVAMAPPRQAAPRRADGTRRCGSTSSSSPCKESTWDPFNRRRIRRFRLQLRRVNLRFRPLRCTSGLTDPLHGFLVMFLFTMTSSFPSYRSGSIQRH